MGTGICSQETQIGLMVRPGNGTGAAEHLVERLTGRREVGSIATERRSQPRAEHAQTQESKQKEVMKS